MIPRRDKKPTPAALALTVHVEIANGQIRTVYRPLIEQCSPTDPLRLRLVASDPNVQKAFKMARASYARVLHAARHACTSAEAAFEHDAAVRAHEALVRGFVRPTILRAEARRRVLNSIPPDLAELARKVIPEATADHVFAVQNLLRRNPHWREPLLWEAPDTFRYLRKAVRSEARFIALRQRISELPLKRAEPAQRNPGVRLLRTFRSPAEAPLLRREELAERRRRQRKGLELLQRLRDGLPPDHLRILGLMQREGCGAYEAAGRLGLTRSTAVAFLARARRLRAKVLKSQGSAALH